MRNLKLAVAMLAIVAVGALPAGSATAGDTPAAAAAKKGPKCKGKKKGKRGSTPKGCKRPKKKPVATRPVPDPAPDPIVGPPGPQTEATALTLLAYENVNGQEQIRGEISLATPRCIVGRTVQLFEEQGAADTLVTTIQIGNNSVFEIPVPPQTPGDVFYAVAPQEFRGGATCLAATSNTIGNG